MYAVIPAAGLGSRMGELASSRSKVFLNLSGDTTVLQLTIRAIVSSECCTGIVVLTRESECNQVRKLLRREAPKLDAIVGVGGETRQESVYAGLLLLEGKAQFALIHDGARPLCPANLIRRVAHAGVSAGAAILASPVKPTIKDVRSTGTIDRTVPRSSLWEAQTPQVFRYSLIRNAHEAARTDGYVGTDDSELVERMGTPVTVVPGSERNIKITTPFDLELAAMLLSGEGERSL